MKSFSGIVELKGSYCSHLGFLDDYVLTQHRLCCWRNLLDAYCLVYDLLGIPSAASSSSSKSSSRSTRQASLYRSWNYHLHQLVITGLEEFDVGSPKELQDYLTYFAREMDSAGSHYFIFRKKSNSYNVNEEVSLVLFFFFDYGLVTNAFLHICSYHDGNP